MFYNTGKEVSPKDTFVDKLIGRTFEMRCKKAESELQDFCDKLNSKSEETKTCVEMVKKKLSEMDGVDKIE
jgi:hypothetical protein